VNVAASAAAHTAEIISLFITHAPFLYDSFWNSYAATGIISVPLIKIILLFLQESNTYCYRKI
ncbi:MAG: hypothetical protein IJG16_00795, partial [Clostridia bacterium]|nr:hypothetical protein [Clostridia bacterium]